MKILYRLSDKVTLEIPCTNRTDVIDKLAAVSEAFGHEAMKKCGCCGGTNLEYRTHSGEGANGAYTIRKLKCMNKECNADLKIVCGEKNGRAYMFPDTQNQDKTEKPNKGWSVYQKKAATTTVRGLNDDIPTDDSVPF